MVPRPNRVRATLLSLISAPLPARQPSTLMLSAMVLSVVCTTTVLAQNKIDTFAGFSVNASVDHARFSNFAEVSGKQPDIRGYTADNSYTGFGVGLDYDLTRWSVRLHTGLSYGTQSFQQDYGSSNALSPVRVTGDVSAMFTDFGFAFRFPLARTALLAGAGGTWARNSSTFESTYANCDACAETNTRVLNRVRPHLHLGWEFQLPSNLRLRTGLSHIGTFNSNDADDHFRLSAGLGYSFRHSF